MAACLLTEFLLLVSLCLTFLVSLFPANLNDNEAKRGNMVVALKTVLFAQIFTAQGYKATREQANRKEPCISTAYGEIEKKSIIGQLLGQTRVSQ